MEAIKSLGKGAFGEYRVCRVRLIELKMSPDEKQIKYASGGHKRGREIVPRRNRNPKRDEERARETSKSELNCQLQTERDVGKKDEEEKKNRRTCLAKARTNEPSMFVPSMG